MSDNTSTTSGKPISEHTREIDPVTGMQKDYIILSEEERAKGFVRPVCNQYRHIKCGAVTRMTTAISETYARDPKFYGATFCAHCRTHLPVGEEGEFVWDGNHNEMDGKKVGA